MKIKADVAEEDNELMNEQALRKASREELLQLLIESTKERERLLAYMEAMRKEVEDTRAKMKGYTVAVEEAGSIAEASVQLSGVFSAAQRAADIYVANIRHLQEEQEAACKQRKADSKRLAGEIIAQAEQKCLQMEQKTKRRCEELYRAAEQVSKMDDKPCAQSAKRSFSLILLYSPSAGFSLRNVERMNYAISGKFCGGLLV